MTRFESSITILRPVTTVVEAFWRVKRWPEVAKHLEKVEMHFEDDNVQVLSMHVNTLGQHDVFKTVRIRQRDVIHFFQPIPPSMLQFHQGAWHFVSSAGGTDVICRHSIVVDPEGTLAFFGSTGKEIDIAECETKFVQVIKQNSNRTMVAIKRRLEPVEINDGVSA